MGTIHVGEPEPTLFLSLALDEIQAYRAQHGEYPQAWYLLDFTFGYGPYRLSDPGVRPTKELGNHWCPKGCDYTYVIRAADREHFLVEAINDEGLAEYRIDQSTPEPAQVAPDSPPRAQGGAGP